MCFMQLPENLLLTSGCIVFRKTHILSLSVHKEENVSRERSRLMSNNNSRNQNNQNSQNNSRNRSSNNCRNQNCNNAQNNSRNQNSENSRNSCRNNSRNNSKNGSSENESDSVNDHSQNEGNSHALSCRKNLGARNYGPSETKWCPGNTDV